MKTRLFFFALVTATLVGITPTVGPSAEPLLSTRMLRATAPALASAQEAESITALKPPTSGDTSPSAQKPSSRTDDRSAGTAAGGLTLGWAQLRELFLGFSSVPMWMLVACSVLTVMLVIERLTALQSRRVMPRAFVTRFLQRLREGPLDSATVHELTEVCRENDSPISHFFAIVVANHGRPAFEIRVTVSDFADAELFHLRKHIRAISGLAMLAPLLGLFGTVLGMISAFHALSQQTGVGKTELLASGISLALVATASGLAVAIIASAAYYYLLGRVDRLIQEMDVLTNQAVALVASDSRSPEARSGDGRSGDAEKRPRRIPALASEQKSA